MAAARHQQPLRLAVAALLARVMALRAPLHPSPTLSVAVHQHPPLNYMPPSQPLGDPHLKVFVLRIRISASPMPPFLSVTVHHSGTLPRRHA